MRGLSLILVLLVTIFNQSSDSPHGKDFDISCSECHNSSGWKIDKNEITFNHDLTKFHLEGLHIEVSCSSCHSTLVFSDADLQCMTCHTDMHQQTVGFDCARCHNSNSWIVTNITEIHQQGRFPLLGAHITADCYDCHKSASLLQFEPLGVECVDCHQSDYTSTTNPNHAESGFSTECADCHQLNAFSWLGSSFTHGFFPLTHGHQINDCASCHTGNDYSNISSECISCHQADYNTTSSPNHLQADLSTDCLECHTTNPGWKPADFTQHDNVFPIYSGEHNGEWASCVDCHTSPGNYSIFTCIDCHEHNKNEMDDEHQGIGGYLYSSPACLECHPTGSEEGSFNHNLSIFPLTGAHITTECADCHTSGYVGTSTVCFECHTPDFNQTLNPNHVAIELSTDCETCHTTAPGWQPATFDVHNDYYILTGAHTTTDCLSCHETGYIETPNLCIDCHTLDFEQSTNPNHVAINLSTDCESCHTTAPGWQPATFDIHSDYYILAGAHTSIDCNSCHEDQYTGTPNTCVGCHMDDFNQTNDPPHASAQFSTDCLTCHTEFVWDPSTFEHDGQYFPIYSGKHQGEWNTCSECHTNSSNYELFSCIDCHEHNQADMDSEHTDEPDYVYNSIACLDCHPDGDSKSLTRHTIKIIR
jgi:decaheme cytochrome c component MtrC/MtrF-like protein